MDVELATMHWGGWWNNRRLHEPLGYRTSDEVDSHHYETVPAQLESNNTGTNPRTLHVP